MGPKETALLLAEGVLTTQGFQVETFSDPTRVLEAAVGGGAPSIPGFPS
jgi:hypothetical protein